MDFIEIHLDRATYSAPCEKTSDCKNNPTR